MVQSKEQGSADIDAGKHSLLATAKDPKRKITDISGTARNDTLRIPH
jgi:hypothetical protein